MQQWSASQQPQAAPQQLPIGCSRLAYVNALPGVFAAAQRATSSSHSASSSSSSSGGGPSGGRKPQDESDFGANFGEAVVLLREDLPLLFERDPRWHIYRDDITFATPSMRYTTGLWKYKLLHKAARWLGNLLYADCSVSLTRMWQTAGNRRQLRVRWCVSGRPRLSLSVDDRPEKTEVISTYTFDASGKIFQHRLDRLIPPESRLFRALESLIELLQPGMLPQPQLPIPGLRDGL